VRTVADWRRRTPTIMALAGIAVVGVWSPPGPATVANLRESWPIGADLGR
jgi:hypothetical protein